MNIILKSSMLALALAGLVSCSSEKAPPEETASPTAAPASSMAPTENESVAPVAAEAPSPFDGTKIKHDVFAKVELCVKASYTQAQCDRARGTALAMVAAGPALFSSREDCQKVFKSCYTHSDLKSFTPDMVAFSMGGEKPGSAGPTPESPSFYAPIFLDAKGKPVLAIIEPGGVRVVPPTPLPEAPAAKSATPLPNVSTAPAAPPVSR